ncbi:MAG: tripartite tricarboxylate transporter TctB family protein [Candidatus Binatia bacterium]
MKRSATTASVILLAFALGALYESLKLPFGRVNTPAPGFFPTVLAVLLVLVSFLTWLAALRQSAGSLQHSEPLSFRKILWNLAALAAFTLLLESLGFLATTIVFLILLLRVVERQSWRMTVTVALCASVASYMILKRLLGIPLPMGFFEI